MKIGITGATGQLGKLVVEKLGEKTSKENLVGLVRTPEKAERLGIESRAFDYDQPEGLADSLKGIDKLLLISGNEIGQRARQHKNIVNAAKEAGVKHIAYTSILRADTSEINLAAEHLATEKFIEESGIPHTILRNGWYTENYTASIPGALEAGAFVGSAGEGKISSAPRKDYAEAAAVVLTSENQEGKTYELAGDQAYTLRELAAEISNNVGKEVPYADLPETEYAGILEKVGLPTDFAKAIASWDVDASHNELYSESKDLSNLIGRTTTPMSETVKETVA